MASTIAIVTGGGHGIGKEITKVLLKHAYKVAIFDVNKTTGTQTVEEFRSQFRSGSCVFYACDVTDSNKLKGCYDNVITDLGHPSVVVNNAAIADEKNWKKMLDINLKAYVDMTYLAVDRMRKDKGGHGGIIVNVASGLGLKAIPGLVVYTSSKWGVIGFTQSMAASLALAEQDWGISLLTLCPSVVANGLANGWNDMDQVVSPHMPLEKGKAAIQASKDRGMLSPEQIGTAFEKLLSDNKNGSVMRVIKDGENIKLDYMEQKWSEVK